MGVVFITLQGRGRMGHKFTCNSNNQRFDVSYAIKTLTLSKIIIQWFRRLASSQSEVRLPENHFRYFVVMRVYNLLVDGVTEDLKTMQSETCMSSQRCVKSANMVKKRVLLLPVPSCWDWDKRKLESN